MRKKISVVVPIYNESSSISQFLDEQLCPELKTLSNYNTEIILVDDGSTDATIDSIKNSNISASKTTSEIKIISFSHNFGKEAALSAGIKYAEGDAVILIDADGQHPVETIPEMISRWEKGAKVVTAVRTKNNTKHKIGSSLFYKAMHLLGNSSFVEGAMDFRLIDREVANAYNLFTEHNRIARGLIDWLGFPQEYIKVNLHGRMSGKGTYGFKKLAALAIDSFVSMSRTPLTFFGYLGLFITFFSLILGLFILIEQYILGDPLNLDWSGAVAMCVFISFLIGIVLISQGITALYISQIHTEVKNRPLFVINNEKSMGIIKPNITTSSSIKSTSASTSKPSRRPKSNTEKRQ